MSVINTPEEKNIEGIMIDLMKQLSQLAPHPDRPDHKGPLFISIDPSLKPAAEYDGMLGSMVLEGLLGTAFSEAASASIGGWSTQFDWSNAAECASQFMQDRQPANSNFQIGQRNAISGAFNESVTRGHLMEAFMRDLPRRMGLERFLAYYQRRLYGMRKQATANAFALAA